MALLPLQRVRGAVRTVKHELFPASVRFDCNHGDLFCGCGHRFVVYDSGAKRMVRYVAKAVMESAELALCPGVDCALSMYGDCRLACLATTGMGRRDSPVDAFRGAVAAQRRMDWIVLWSSAALDSFRRGRAALVRDFSNYVLFWARDANRRLVVGAVSDLGNLCRCA